MSSARRILIDSDVLIGYMVKDDAHRARALDGMKRLFAESEAEPMLTTAVVGETATVLSNKANQPMAIRFIDWVEQSDITVILITQAIHDKTMQIFREQKRHKTSFVDCSNVATIRTQGIEQVYAFDKVYHRDFQISNFAYPDL